MPISPRRLHTIRFKFSKSRLMYWAYACLNKQFKKEVKLQRDPLHSRYAVNKHSFSVSTNTAHLQEVEHWFEDNLKKAGFEKKVQSGLAIFEKQNEAGDTWGYCIAVRPKSSAQKSFDVSPFFYERV